MKKNENSLGGKLKPIIGTLAVIFVVFLVSVCAVLMEKTLLKGQLSFENFTGNIKCYDTDPENDELAAGYVILYNIENPKRALSKLDRCKSSGLLSRERKFESIEYVCNPEVFPEKDSSVSKEEMQKLIKSQIHPVIEAGKIKCQEKCGWNKCAL